MRNYFIIFYALFAFLFFSCQDDDINNLPEQPEEEQIDSYVGEQNIIKISEGMEKFRSKDFICRISVPDGEIINRKGDHIRIDGTSILTLKNGLKDGIYRLIELKYPEVVENSQDTIWHEYGMGCRFEVSDQGVTIMDTFDKKIGLYGSGTKEDPYKISSSDNLLQLLIVNNDYDTYQLLKSDTYFEQTDNLYMNRTSWECSNSFGWLGIGTEELPFRSIYNGNNKVIKQLHSNPYNEITPIDGKDKKDKEIIRNVTGIGLFAYTAGAILKNIKLESVDITGNFGVGGLAGVVMSGGDKRDHTTILSCGITKSSIKGTEGSIGIGGLVGVTDILTILTLDSCSCESTTVTGDYGIGGLLGNGSQYSLVFVSDSKNGENSNVNGNFSCVGGLVGTVDSLSVVSSINKGKITGGIKYSGKENESAFATGGLVGGALNSKFYSCYNEGEVTGHLGVGGLLGSTRLGKDDTGSGEVILRNTLVQSSKNKGYIKGVTSVGGICGEAQFGCYGVLNEGTVEATEDNAVLGGIVGNTSVCLAHNALNNGSIQTTNGRIATAAGGIVGQVVWGSIFACQNFGQISLPSKHVAGVAALAGNYSVVSYCSNFGSIINSLKDGYVGGVVGKIGDPREWTGGEIACMVLAGVGAVYSVAAPFISMSGEALKKAGKKIWGDIFIAVNDYFLPVVLTLKDIGMLSYSSYQVACPEDTEERKKDLEQKTQSINDQIFTEMANIRNSKALEYTVLPAAVNSDVIVDYINNNNDILNYYELSEHNMENINHNINLKRQDRYKEVEEKKHVAGIVHRVVDGVCLVVGVVTSIAGVIVTGGAWAAVIATAGAVGGVLGSANSIIETSTNFKNNAVIVSQCVNMGSISAGKDATVGGVIGYLDQYGVARDCLNGGDNPSKNSGGAGILGYGQNATDLRRCLNLNTNWNSSIYKGVPTKLHDFYQYSSKDKISSAHVDYLNAEELGQIKSYDDWDLSTDNSKLWQLKKEEEGNFPVPCKSEMQ